MRIVGGTHRSVALVSVGKGDATAHLRPTTDRVRESLFNILNHRINLSGVRVLDLFAGTGALGFEALSRGAAHVTFVDNGRVAAQLVAANAAKLRTEQQTRFIRCDARNLPINQGTPHDLVFIDPPYGKGLGVKALEAAEAGGWLAKEVLIVWEEAEPVQAQAGFTVEESRKFGNTHVTLLSKTRT